MSGFSTTCFSVLLLLVAAEAQPQRGAGLGELDSRFEEDQRIETDTALGEFTVGVSGISENVRLGSTSGDVEVGYLYQYELNTDFPRILELRPFLFNRAGYTETTYYESLGVGAGLRLTLREKYEENNWFARFSILTPSDNYHDQYAADRDQPSVIELFAGYEIPLGDVGRGRDLRNRISPSGLIQMRVPTVMLSGDRVIEPGLLADAHTLMIGAYLREVSQRHDLPAGPRRGFAADWPVLYLIEEVTGQRLTEWQWQVLTNDSYTQADERTEMRRGIVAEFMRRGLTEMMQGPYPLLFQPFGNRAGQVLVPERRATTVAFISRPGTTIQPSGRPLDADTMIDHYISYAAAQVE